MVDDTSSGVALHLADDANEVVLLFEAQDVNRAKAFTDSSDLHEKMEEIGVIDKPDIYFLNE